MSIFCCFGRERAYVNPTVTETQPFSPPSKDQPVGATGYSGQSTMASAGGRPKTNTTPTKSDRYHGETAKEISKNEVASIQEDY